MENSTIEFKRKAYHEILDWKAKLADKTALLVEGARRVGKTHLVKRFAQREYENFIYIDFSAKGKQIRAYRRAFEECDDVENLLERLQILSGVRLVTGRSCVIFDEVQRYPAARVSRLCACALLGLTQNDTENAPLPENALLLGLRKKPEKC